MIHVCYELYNSFLLLYMISICRPVVFRHSLWNMYFIKSTSLSGAQISVLLFNSMNMSVVVVVVVVAVIVLVLLVVTAPVAVAESIVNSGLHGLQMKKGCCFWFLFW